MFFCVISILFSLSIFSKHLFFDFTLTGITGNECFSSIVAVDDNVLILAGESSLMSGHAIILKSKDKGLNWKLCYNGVGKISSLVNIDSVIYAVQNLFQLGKGVKSKLFKSVNCGENWKEVKYTGEAIDKIYFISKEEGVLFVSINNEEKLLKTVNGGNTWDEIKIFKDNLLVDFDFLTSKNGIMYGTYRNVFNKDSVRFFSLNIKNNDFQSVPIIENIGTEKVLKFDELGYLFLSTQVNKVLKVYKVDNHLRIISSFNIENTNDTFLDLFVFNGNKFALMDDFYSNRNFNNYRFYRLNSETNQSEKIDKFDNMVFKPYCQYGGVLYGYIGNGKLRKIDLKK